MDDVRHREEVSPSYSWYVRDWRASFRVRTLSWKERGFYRECLDWSWDLDGLPNDLDYIRGRLHATKGDFDKMWPAARQFYDLAGDGRWRNARQELERVKQLANRRRASDGGKAGGRGRAPTVIASPIASSYPTTVPATIASSTAPHIASPSPSPVPSPSPSPLPLRPPLPSPVNSRSKRPIFDGQRIAVFEWMLDDLRKMLGAHTDDFHLDEWFYTADRKALEMPDVRKRDDWWPWLLGETLEEAKRRGLPVSTAEWAKTGQALVGDDALWAAIVKKGPPK